jgi:hypothetical protein
VQHAVVGETRHEEFGDFPEYLPVLERRAEQSAGFSEKLPYIVDAPPLLEYVQVQQIICSCGGSYIRGDDGGIHAGEHSRR